MRWALAAALVAAFSPDEVENALSERLQAIERIAAEPEPCDCAQSFLQTGLRGGPRVMPDIQGTGACGCTHKVQEDEPERMLVDQCSLNYQDMEIWGLRKTAFNPGGVELESTVGYADTCDGCTKHGLKCGAQTTIDPGYCLCMWRIDGGEPVQAELACGECVDNCIAKFMQVDLGISHELGLANGLCIRKKDYR